MQIGTITPSNIDNFQTLLLPGEASAIREGDPILSLGIVEDDTACGALSGWLTESQFEIASLYVAPGYRRKGGGRLMLDTLCDLLRDDWTDTLEISYTKTLEEHELLRPFLEAYGFQRKENLSENLYRIPLKELYKLPFFSGENKPSPNVKPFSELPAYMLENAYKKELVYGIDYLGHSLADASVDADMSVALVKGTDIQAFLAFDRSLVGQLTLAWTKGSENPADLISLFRTAVARSKEFHDPEELLYVQAIDQITASLVNKILAGAEPISETYTLRIPNN